MAALIDRTTGRVLWRQPEIAPTPTTLAAREACAAQSAALARFLEVVHANVSGFKAYDAIVDAAGVLRGAERDAAIAEEAMERAERELLEGLRAGIERLERSKP